MPRTKIKRPRLLPFIVGVANDLTEYAYIRIFAQTDNDAETIVSDLIDSNQLPNLQFEPGDDREGPYTVDSSPDKGDHPWVKLTITNRKVISAPPEAFELKCPHCKYDGIEESPHGGTFRYLTNTPIFREIKRFKSSPKGRRQELIVDARSDRYQEDNEDGERIECRNCLNEFSLPKSLKVTFV